MIEKGSRYEGVELYAVRDRRGREVRVYAPFPPPAQSLLGVHLRRDGQRLDHLAHHYLADPTAFWRICEENDAMVPDALAESSEIRIPRRER